MAARSVVAEDDGTTRSAWEPHVAQFIDSMDPGGAESLVMDLCRILTRRGFRVTVIHFGNPWMSRRVSELNLDEVVLSDNRDYKSKYRLPLFLWRMRRILIRHKVDLLHCHLLGAVFAGAISARLAALPSIGTLHDAYSLEENGHAARMLGLAAMFGCRIVAVSDHMRKTARARVSSRDLQISLIHNGIRIGDFDVSKAAPNRPDEPVIIATVARFVAVKRLDHLLKAVSELQSEKLWELHLIGEGPLEAKLRGLAETLGISDRVRFRGFRDDIKEILASSHIFALSSESEGLSISIMESMASGLAAVVTDVGGNSELVVNDVSGFVVAPDDTAALTAALVQLINDARLRERFGKAARQRAKCMFDTEIMIDRYVDLYRSASRRNS